MNICIGFDLQQTEKLRKHLRSTSVFEDEKSNKAKEAVLEKLNDTVVKEFVTNMSMKRVNF